MRAELVAEKAAIPAVGIIGSMFMEQSKFVASAYGVPGARFAEWPGAIDTSTDSYLQETTEKILIDRIIDGLTKESSSGLPVQAAAKNPEEVVCTGTFEEVNDFFYRNGWSDGIPIIPPTNEAVREMLKWTGRSPNELIGVLDLANRKATPWNIAVNAVMAGCRPEYLPVLIAAVEAIADPVYQLKDLGSTSSIKPFFVINGPIIKQLDLNYGTSVQSLGRRANSTIGRALGLIVRNIAGFIEGVTWMGQFGWPGFPAVIAEDEDASPWAPFHVDRGFKRNESAVTAGMMMHSSYQLMTAGGTSQPYLTGLCHYVAKSFGSTWMYFEHNHKRFSIFISPPNAAVIARDGYSKQGVKEYITKYAKLRVSEINKEHAYTHQKVEPRTVHSLAQEGVIPKEWDLGPEEEIPFVGSPDLIDIFVCGSRDRNRNLIFRTGYCNSTTRKIIMPEH